MEVVRALYNARYHASLSCAQFITQSSFRTIHVALKGAILLYSIDSSDRLRRNASWNGSILSLDLINMRDLDNVQV